MGIYDRDYTRRGYRPPKPKEAVERERAKGQEDEVARLLRELAQARAAQPYGNPNVDASVAQEPEAQETAPCRDLQGFAPSGALIFGCGTPTPQPTLTPTPSGGCSTWEFNPMVAAEAYCIAWR